MNDFLTTDAIEATLQIRDLDTEVEVLQYRGREAVGELFAFELTVSAHEPLDVDRLIAGSATLTFSAGGARMRAIEGVIAQCVDLLSAETTRDLYRLRLVPTWWRATLVELIDVFMDMDLPALVEHKLGLIDMHPEHDFVLRLKEPSPVREFIVQYQESDLSFLARQLEHLGLSFFFEHHDDREVLVIADHNGAFSPIGEGGVVPFHGRGEVMGIFELTQATDVIPAHYIQRDYNYRQPDIDLLADVAMTGPGRAGGHYEYGGHFKSLEEAKRIAQIRAEERACRQKVIEGRSVLPQLRAGGRTTVTGHRRGDLELIVTAVEHRGSQGFYAKDGPRYENRFEAVTPEVTFRPRRATPRPRITGMLTGIVESASDSDYADVDDQGRYRVRFLFDTNAPGERQASRPIRMMQPHAGPGYGMHFPLRGGVEVLIAFVGGDPDRPIIAGTVPNPHTPSPVVQGNRERNVIRTGAGNEINIDDTEGEERIKLSTPKHGSTLQLGSPNSPESGVVAESTASVTSAATGSVNQIGSFGNSWSLWSNLWGNHVTAVAGKVLPFQVAAFTKDVVTGTYEQISSNIGAILAIHDTISQFIKNEVDKAEKELEEAKTDQEDAENALASVTPPGKTPAEVLAEKKTTLDTKTDALLQELAVDWQGYSLSSGTVEYTDSNGQPQTLSAEDKARIEGFLSGDTTTTIDIGDPDDRAMATAALEAEIGQLSTPPISDDDKKRIASLQERLAALKDQDLADKQAAVAELEASLPERRQELAVLEAQRAEIEAAGGDTSDIDDLIGSKKDEIDAASTNLDEAKAAASSARERRDQSLADLHDALTSASDPNSNAFAEYDQAHRDYATYNAAVLAVEEAERNTAEAESNLEDKKDLFEDANAGFEETKDYKDTVDASFKAIDSLATLPYSWFLALHGTGMQGYAAKCADLMIKEARAQREGALPPYVVADTTWKTRNAKQAPTTIADRVNHGWGSLSRLEWLPDDRAVKGDYDEADKDKEYHDISLRGGGGGSLLTAFEHPKLAIAASLVSIAFGPVMGPVMLNLLSKTHAFEESRNIQGSEQKAVLFGKESAFVNGQKNTTVASGGKLVMTAAKEAVFHTRGEAEVVGIDSVYLASAKKVDILSRGTMELSLTDRGGRDHTYKEMSGDQLDVTVAQMRMSPSTPQEEPQNGVWAQAPEMAGEIEISSWKNKNPKALLSSLSLNGKDAALSVDGLGAGAGAFADAKLRLECKQQGAIQSYLELSETASSKTAKLLAGDDYGLSANAGQARYAELKGEENSVVVHNRTIQLDAGDDWIQITRGNGITLTSKRAVMVASKNTNFSSETIDFGGAKINHPNMMVKPGPSIKLASIKARLK